MKKPIYAALDLHSRMSVLGSMDPERFCSKQIAREELGPMKTGRD